MAADEDKESKTHEASQRRIEEALKKGNTPFSREVGPAAIIVSLGLLVPVFASYLGDHLMPGLHMFLDQSGGISLGNAQEILTLATFVGKLALIAVGPLLLILVVIGLVAAGVQNVPRFVLHRIKPEFGRLSPGKGLERIFSKTAQVEFGKSLVKIAVFVLTFLFSLRGSYVRISNSLLSDANALPQLLVNELASLLLTTGGYLVAIGLIDVFWSRFKWRLDLRMSLQELKEEQKTAEGDPAVKARQRAIARDRARKSMMASVPKATLVIANPTHYAIALRYVHGESAVPVVLARGIDHLALRIREIAEDHDIPVVEDRALARSLYEVVRVDRPIPPEFYRAVAEIILFFMSRRSAGLPRREIRGEH